MGPIGYVIAILGCADGGASCQTVATLAPRYESAAQCAAARNGFHAEVGAYAQTRGLDALWAVGALCKDAAAAFDGARHFDAVDDLIAAMAQSPECSAVLVKGSRFMQMERVVAALMGHTSAGDPHAA